MVAQPVLQQVGDAITGQRSTRQAIDFMFGFRCIFADMTADHADFDIAVLIKDFLAFPLRSPFRVVDFTAQTRCLGMFVEAQALDGVKVTLQ